MSKLIVNKIIATIINDSNSATISMQVIKLLSEKKIMRIDNRW